MSEFNAENLWGIDMGGTKIEGIILKSKDEPKELFRHRVPTEAHLGYDHILNQFAKLVAQMEHHAGYKADIIGLASPGTYIPSKGIMKNCNATVINGRNFKVDLENQLKLRIRLANDANCFALAEAKLGVAKDLHIANLVLFGVILGTGVGGGIVVNGRLINGKHGIGGEWGHNYLYPEEGELCYCGKRGCNEQILSGPALEKYYLQQSGISRSLKEIHQMHLEKSDPIATNTILRLQDGFAKALSIVINIVDPDIIVIGGGVSHIDSIYEESGLLKRMIFNNEFETPIVKAKLGDSAGVYGAALLVCDNSSQP
ncbi:ROK family protein [Belliella marina]|uniref:ROK family protein n=1 Tax=Belliella marina TaxID=1644146 RepID=A0ABW4VQK4_9BACT